MGKTKEKLDNKKLLNLKKNVSGYLSAKPAFLTTVSGILSTASVILTAINNSIKITIENENKLFTLYKILLLIIFIFFSPLFISSLINLIRNKNIRFYEDKYHGPKYRDNIELLKIIARKKINLIVIGRTNISWFINPSEKMKYYKGAIKNDCKISFIIQCDDVVNSNIDDSTKQTIKDDLLETIKNYNKIYTYLINETSKGNFSVNGKFELFLSRIPVNNSMTACYKNDDNYIYFTYDIGQNDKDSRNPYLVFLNNTVIPEIKNEFKNIKDNSINYFLYNVKNEIDDLLNKYSLFSVQRENKNKKMLYHYFKRKNCLKKAGFYPPFSIHLSITNKCTAQCIMCDHHSIKPKNGLSKIELMNIIDYIHDIGTKNIIISGGEPLSRCDCIGILEYAKNKELNVGLLTNGVKKDSESITLCEARRIKEYCDWVQLSIDSFEEATYKQIRNIDLSIVKESLENLEAAGVNLEVVFTIQRLNIDEAIKIVTTGKTAFGFKSKVRFKFAHGPDNGNNFLLTGEKNKLEEFLKNSDNDIHFYAEYFNKMIANDSFFIDDILRGVPLYSKNKVFKSNNYKCHAINYSCIIDAEGDVYPCCFLYDDNAGDSSTIRNKYCLGTLRTNGVIAHLSSGENILKDILSKENNRFSNTKMPVDEEACNYCTRHFYQNEFLNKLEEIISDYKNCDFSALYLDEDSNSKIWF